VGGLELGSFGEQNNYGDSGLRLRSGQNDGAGLPRRNDELRGTEWIDSAHLSLYPLVEMLCVGSKYSNSSARWFVSTLPNLFRCSEHRVFYDSCLIYRRCCADGMNFDEVWIPEQRNQ